MNGAYKNLLTSRDPFARHESCPAGVIERHRDNNAARFEEGKQPISLGDFVSEWRLRKEGLRYRAMGFVS